MTVIVEPHAEGAVIHVLAQPGGRRNAVVGEHDGRLKVSVTQAPEKGKANDAIVELLCETLGLRRREIAIIAGETTRRKKFLVRDVSPEKLTARMANVMENL